MLTSLKTYLDIRIKSKATMAVIHFDEIFDDIGHFKTYQILAFFAIGIVNLSPGYQSFMNNFMAPNQDHWCRVLSLDNLTGIRQKYIAIPSEGDKYSNCKMFDLNFHNITTENTKLWNRTEFIGSNVSTKPCEDFIFDRSVFYYTILEQYKLVCDRAWLIPLVSSIYLFGQLIGAVVSGILSDTFGRKKTMIGMVLLGGCAAVAAAFAPTYLVFVILRMFCGAAATGKLLTGFVLLMESVGPQWRLILSIVFHNWFALGFCILPGIAYFVRDSFILQLIMAAPSVIELFCVAILVESPRWLISQKRFKDARRNLNRMATFNKTELPQDLDPEAIYQQSVVGKQIEQRATIFDLFRTPNLRNRTFVQCLNWFGTSLGYYGLSLSAGVLPGDVFLNTFFVAVTQIPAISGVTFFVFRFGRRPSQSACLLLAGACCLGAIPLILNKGIPQWIVTALAVGGNMFAAASFAIVYLYAGELYPTVIRTNGVGFCSMSARIGSTISPQLKLTIAAWEGFPFLIFGVVPLIAGLLTLTLPETKDLDLPETIQESENLGKRGVCVVDSSEDIMPNKRQPPI